MQTLRFSRRLIVALAVVAAAALWVTDQGLRAWADVIAVLEDASDAGPDSAATGAAPAAAAQQRTAKQAPAAATNQMGQITDAAGRRRPVQQRKVTPEQRQAAAQRLRAKIAAGRLARGQATAAMTALAAPLAAAAAVVGQPAAAAAAFGAPLAATAMLAPAGGFLIGPNGELVPDYSGMTGNWAYSPVPTLSTPTGTLASAGNPVVEAPIATDSATAVFVILATPLPVGELQAFQVFNQITGANAPSAPNQIHGYVLRPTVNPNEYSVVFDSGPLDIPAVAANEVTTFPLATPVPVQAGDVIAFYGRGVPLVIGAGTDILIYPPPVVTAVAGTFTIGAAPFPIYPQARTYSFGAVVLDTAGATPVATGGIRKFVDTLPLLGPTGANNILQTHSHGEGQYIPIATPDQTTYACATLFPAPASPPATCRDADYYEIELGQYTEKMHSDLPPTTLRGYRQTNMGGTNFHYLGPLIVATKGRPVRITFTNSLPTGGAGNLFVPTDVTVMGAGPGANVSDADRVGPPTGTGQPADVLCMPDPVSGVIPVGCYTQNRATLHLHGGVTPWISDGTPHQWITPATEATAYSKGVSVYNVPDMPFPGKPASPDPAAGSQTFYYTNDQAARLMFYHDHASGITRLNVYVGEAAGYLIRDDTEIALETAGIIPGLADTIPLIVQDKTFVDPNTIGVQDPTWNWGTGPATTYVDPLDPAKTMLWRAPQAGDLWWPHVYQPAQNPYDLSGYNATGRWNYGPWFWPPTTGIPYGPVSNPYYQAACADGPTAPGCTRPEQPPLIPGTPNPSWGAEAFMDTPVINGTVYPTLRVKAKAYRFRILNAAHDRFWNLQFFLAADKNSPTTAGTTGALLCDPTPADPSVCTEVKMVPAAPNTGLPDNWPQDGRAGGVPDPATAGPGFYVIGSEGGFLPRPVYVAPQPVVWNADPLTFNFGNVSDFSLLLGPAERSDAIVDFTAYAGKTLILYNDAPAAFPALDPRNDPYTGNPDQTDTGGPVPTLPGYGPNIRTIMQVIVEEAQDDTFDPLTLMAAWMPGNTVPGIGPAGVFEHSQDPIIVGQGAQPAAGFSGYDGVYTNNPTFPATAPYWGLGSIFDYNVSFETVQGDRITWLAEPKAIQDEMGETFDDYGRMSAKLGLTTPGVGKGFVLQGYADPATELIKLSDIAVPVGTPFADGTQIWRVTHNGVDTHPVHFHLFHVQLINRVGWDGAYRLPHPTELGWKDTVRISPLEDTYVALRPISPRPEALPFKVPNSYRPLEPSLAPGSVLAFTNIDPAGNPVVPPIVNDVYNFGWEYVWHCHILSHEENDMMRAVVFAATPETPAGLTGSRFGNTVNLSWIDNSMTANGYSVLRASNAGLTTNVTTFGPFSVTPCLTSAGCTRTFQDTAVPAGTWYYSVQANNTVGANTAGLTVPGYPTITADSLWTTPGVLPVAAPRASVSPTSLAFGNRTVGSSTVLPVVLTNTGSAALIVNSITVNGAAPLYFSQTNSCGASLAVGGSCTINVTFAPATTGARTGSLNIATNDPAQPTLSVPLSGTGIVANTVHVAALQGQARDPQGPGWQARATISVRTGTNQPLNNVLVRGTWSSGTGNNGTLQCTTNGAGVCTTGWRSLTNGTANATFTVTSLTRGGYTYDQAANTPNPPTVTVVRPF